MPSKEFMIDGRDDSEYSMTHSQSDSALPNTIPSARFKLLPFVCVTQNFVFSQQNSKGKNQRNVNAILSVIFSVVQCLSMLTTAVLKIWPKADRKIFLSWYSRLTITKANQGRSSREEPGDKNWYRDHGGNLAPYSLEVSVQLLFLYSQSPPA